MSATGYVRLLCAQLYCFLLTHCSWKGELMPSVVHRTAGRGVLETISVPVVRVFNPLF